MKDICKKCLENLGDQTRVEIYFSILKKSKCVSELISQFSLGQSTISYHLGVMLSSGVIIKTQVGRNSYYKATEVCPHYNKECLLVGLKED